MSFLFSVCYWFEVVIVGRRLIYIFLCGFCSYFLELYGLLVYLKNIEYLCLRRMLV